MSKDEIKGILTNIYRDVFDNDSIELFDAMTQDDIEEWDSLTQLRLLIQIEKSFNIKFSVVHIKRIKSVGELINIITELI